MCPVYSFFVFQASKAGSSNHAILTKMMLHGVERGFDIVVGHDLLHDPILSEVKVSRFWGQAGCVPILRHAERPRRSAS